ncbi:hypothetical protein ['Camptotheca acuminata' phytoplasma]|uniref:hypothetical protein n=1 Tax='Camptotheca acuminata' phytoplasma TaxID=3239192 RepID=UPI00351A589C
MMTKRPLFDGTLLYTDYLKDDFNVISIGVSGENPKEMKIDFFLWLQNNLHYSHIQDLNSFYKFSRNRKINRKKSIQYQKTN